MKTREQIITDMCYTWRHDYGLDRQEHDGPGGLISCGLTTQEREQLWRQMAQIYDRCIAPAMEPKHPSTGSWAKYQWNNWVEP
jgi:hypothetical protein